MLATEEVSAPLSAFRGRGVDEATVLLWGGGGSAGVEQLLPKSFVLRGCLFPGFRLRGNKVDFFCARWRFQVAGLFRSTSRVHEAKRKPGKLTTFSLLASEVSRPYLRFIFESSSVCFTYNAQGFKIIFNRRNGESASPSCKKWKVHFENFFKLIFFWL